MGKMITRKRAEATNPVDCLQEVWGLILWSHDKGLEDYNFMSCVVRKPVLRDSNQVRHNGTVQFQRKARGFLNIGSRGIALSLLLISCAITAQLICAFVFAFAKSRYSHEAALMVFNILYINYMLVVLHNFPYISN